MFELNLRRQISVPDFAVSLGFKCARSVSMISFPVASTALILFASRISNKLSYPRSFFPCEIERDDFGVQNPFE